MLDFTLKPSEITRSKELQATAKLTYDGLVLYADLDDATCQVSVAVIAETINLSVSAVRRGIRQLERADFVQTTSQLRENSLEPDVNKYFLPFQLSIRNSGKNVEKSRNGTADNDEGAIENSDCTLELTDKREPEPFGVENDREIEELLKFARPSKDQLLNISSYNTLLSVRQAIDDLHFRVNVKGEEIKNPGGYLIVSLARGKYKRSKKLYKEIQARVDLKAQSLATLKRYSQSQMLRSEIEREKVRSLYGDFVCEEAKRMNPREFTVLSITASEKAPAGKTPRESAVARSELLLKSLLLEFPDIPDFETWLASQ